MRHTHRHKTNTVVALAQAGNEARLRLGWQVGAGARLTEIHVLNSSMPELHELLYVYNKNIFNRDVL